MAKHRFRIRRQGDEYIEVGASSYHVGESGTLHLYNEEGDLFRSYAPPTWLDIQMLDGSTTQPSEDTGNASIIAIEPNCAKLDHPIRRIIGEGETKNSLLYWCVDCGAHRTATPPATLSRNINPKDWIFGEWTVPKTRWTSNDAPIVALSENRMIEWLESVPPKLADKWGPNTITEIITRIKEGHTRLGKAYWEVLRQQP